MSRPTNATKAYIAKHEEVVNNLHRLREYIHAHQLRQMKDTKNWGYAGDLDHINSLLLQALGEAK